MTGQGSAAWAAAGRALLARQPADSRDLLIGDAFGHLVVPWHLATVELTRDVHRVLRADGVYALNAIDRGGLRFVKAEVATIALPVLENLIYKVNATMITIVTPKVRSVA